MSTRLERGGLAHGDAAELADSVLRSRTGFARIVERLEQRSLVRRESRPGAGVEIVLTDSGRSTLLEARKTMLSGVRRLFLQHLTGEEQTTIGAYFDRILEALDERAETAEPEPKRQSCPHPMRTASRS